MSVTTDRTERPAATSAHRVDLIAAGSLVVMWSSGFIGAGLGTRVAPADTLLAWRYVAAAVVVTTWAVVRGIRPDRRTWPRLVLVGLLCQCLYLGGVVTGVGLGCHPAPLHWWPPCSRWWWRWSPVRCWRSEPRPGSVWGWSWAWSGSRWSSG
ncbi:MAG: hypothetical protein ABI776_17830, partial [Nocardioidaceae bacterium]